MAEHPLWERGVVVSVSTTPTIKGIAWKNNYLLNVVLDAVVLYYNVNVLALIAMSIYLTKNKNNS